MHTAFDQLITKYSKFDETQRTSFIEMPLLWGGAALSDATVENGLVTSGTYSGVKAIVRNHGNFRESDLFSAGWKTEFKLADNWFATVDLSHSKLDRTDLILESDAGTGTAGTGATDTIQFQMNGKGATGMPSSIFCSANSTIRIAFFAAKPIKVIKPIWK